LPHRLQVTASSSATGLKQSITAIAPQLINVGTVGYLRRKVLKETDGIITSTFGSDSFIPDFRAFQTMMPDYVKQYEINPSVAIISVQTLWMEKMLSVKRSDIMRKPNADPAIANPQNSLPMVFGHGCITDAANKYFRNGLGKTFKCNSY
jgi:hypothetical protein